MLAITAGLLYWDIFISLVGMAFFMYGRKRPDTVALITGMILMVYPYFFSSTAWCMVAGLAILLIYVILKKVICI